MPSIQSVAFRSGLVVAGVVALLVATAVASPQNGASGMTLQEGSVFTSSGNVHALFFAEKELGSFLNRFLDEQERQLDALKSLVADMNGAVIPPADDDLDPAQGYAILSRLNTLSTKLKEYTDGSSVTELQHVLEQSTLPNDDDLKGAAKAMLRLQRVYNVGPRQLMPTAAPEDIYHVARVAYMDNDIASAAVWFEAVKRRLAKAGKARSPLYIDTLDHLSFLEYKLQNFAKAIEYSHALLALSPNNTRVAQNIEYYQTALEREGAAASLPVSDETFDHNKDNILGHSEEDMSRFRSLCRGDVLYKPTIPLLCKYMNYGKPHLVYQPIKVEYLHEGRQRLQIFREFASPSECMHLREVGGSMLSRAVAWTGGEFQPVEFRISTAAWLKREHDDVIEAIHNRIEDATQVDITHAEHLQVSNYGMGGFYEPHFDHAKRGTNAAGERLSTFMIYLNEVKQGGYTVFPRLGAAVKPGHGDAVFWFNLLPSGEGDNDTLHAACPVLEGSKWVANKWIHEKENVCRKPYPREGLSPDTLI